MSPTANKKSLSTPPAPAHPAAKPSGITQKQLRLILFGVLVLVAVVFVVAAFTGLNTLKSQSQKLVDAKLKSKTVDAQLTSLEQARKEVQQYSYFNDVANTVLPADKDQARAVLDIFQLASQSGISIASVTFPASNLGASSASASAAGSTATAISQAKPVAGINGLYSLELTITPQTGTAVPANKVVTYPKFLDFLRRIERNRRTAQITQVNIQPQGGAAGITNLINFNLTINIFMRPQK